MAAVTGTTSATNIYSALGIKNNGIGGLASGLDTDSLVEALTSATRAKIAKQGQSKQFLKWQQNAYRSVASTLKTFQDKNLKTVGTAASTTNIRSSTFWRAYKSSSSSTDITVNNSSSTAVGTVTVSKVNQLASAEKLVLGQHFAGDLVGKTAALMEADSYTGQTLQLELSNGKTQTIALDSLNGLTGEEFEKQLQNLVDDAMGTRTATAEELADPNLAKYIDEESGKISNVMVSMTEDGKVNLDSKGNSVAVKGDSSALGLAAGQTNRFSTSTTLSALSEKLGLTADEDGNFKFKINGEEFSFAGDSTINSVMDKISNSKANVNLTFNSVTQQFTFAAKSTGGGNNIRLEDVGGNFLEKFTAGSTRIDGANAEILVDGQVVTSASNTFDVGGVNFTVSKVSGAEDKPIVISTVADTDELVDRIQGFLDDYNALVDVFNTLLNEEKNGDYAPLTDEQKATMSEDQIKTWENEAKKGILRNDSTLRGILNDMRQTFTQKVESAGISLYDIGITTMSMGGSTGSVSQANNGKLEISDKSKLVTALNEQSDSVRMLFTDSKDGIGTAMFNTVDRAINTSSDTKTRGSLVRIAGTEALTGDNTSTIGSKIDGIDKYVTTLAMRLQKEYSRHWAKFSALETAISNMSNQSAWLQNG